MFSLTCLARIESQLYLGFYREIKPVGNVSIPLCMYIYIYIKRETFYEELIGLCNSVDCEVPQSTRWRLRKANGVIQSKSKDLRTN